MWYTPPYTTVHYATTPKQHRHKHARTMHRKRQSIRTLCVYRKCRTVVVRLMDFFAQDCKWCDSSRFRYLCRKSVDTLYMKFSVDTYAHRREKVTLWVNNQPIRKCEPVDNNRTFLACVITTCRPSARVRYWLRNPQKSLNSIKNLKKSKKIRMMSS